MNEPRIVDEKFDWTADHGVTPRHTDLPPHEPCGVVTPHAEHTWQWHKAGRWHNCAGVPEPQCGCGIPNRSAYWYRIPMTRDGTRERAIVRLYLCVKHRVDPRDLAAVREKFEFDHSDEWTIDDVECKPAARYVREEDLAAAFGTEGARDLSRAITEAAARPVEVDLRLRSESEEEDTILRHFRGSLHNGAECRACKERQYERRIGDRRVAECQDTIGAYAAKIVDLRRTLNSIIEG